MTRVPRGIAKSRAEGASGRSVLTHGVFHGWIKGGRRVRQNGLKRGGFVSVEIVYEEVVVIDAESEELLVEEVSIDGLCGVY